MAILFPVLVTLAIKFLVEKNSAESVNGRNAKALSIVSVLSAFFDRMTLIYFSSYWRKQ